MGTSSKNRLYNLIIERKGEDNMGLIKAITTAAGTTMADQWKEFFYCESIPNDVLCVKGEKVVRGRSSNTKGSDNIITNGSGIAVADGQCMIIVEQGEIVEVCAEQGEFTFDSSTEPSIFAGTLGESIRQTFSNIGRRFTYGGDTGKDQRVYYFNTKEILENKFGTPTPVPFRVVDKNIGLDVDVSLRCSGIYSFRMTDPLLFYKNVCGNVEREYDVSQIIGQLKTEFVSALQPALGELSELEIRPSSLPRHVKELSEAMNRELSEQWGNTRGIEVVSVALNPITMPEEDQQMLKDLQKTAVYRNPGMAAANLAGAQADALRMAASNENGAMMGFMGMGMVQQAGGANLNGLYEMNNQQMSAAQNQAANQTAAQSEMPANTANAGEWTCECGTVNTAKFCQNCGTKKPEVKEWTCECGTVNTGNFCQNCGTKKPVSLEWTCGCGTVNKGNFCSNCGGKKPE